MSPADSTAAGKSSLSSRGSLDEDSREWLRCLTVTARDTRSTARREQALVRLHELLLRAARAELRRRNHPVRIEGRERDDLAHQAADDALVAIISKLDRFRGESRFTTWAYKFVILEVSAKLARHCWRHAPAQADEDAWEHIPDRFGADPAQHAESRELAAALRRAVGEALTERQRRVFVAIIVDGIPLDALAVELGSTRNALYKTMFDARRKIRAHLVANGYLDDDEPGSHERMAASISSCGLMRRTWDASRRWNCWTSTSTRSTPKAPTPPNSRYPGIAAHLRACGPCGEDFAGLLAAVTRDEP